MSKLSLIFLLSFIFCFEAYAKKPKSDVIDNLKYSGKLSESENQTRAATGEVLIRKVEDKALTQLHRLLKLYKSKPQEVDILFRLSELHMRRAKTDRFFEINKDEKEVVSLVRDKKLSFSQNTEIKKAVRFYDRIRKNFPKYKKLDVVLFNNAYARQNLSDHKGAEDLYRQILKNHKRSRYVAESYLAVGEINYNAQKFSDALKFFKAIQKYPDSRVYSYGIYKGAWALYNLQNTRGAINELLKVISVNEKKDFKGNFNLRKEALSDLALFYSDYYPANEAVNFFISKSKELDPSPYILKLAAIYKGHSKYQEEEAILKEFIQKLAKSEYVSKGHNELLWNYENQKKRDLAVIQLESFLNYCRSLVKKAANDLAKECKEIARGSSSQLSTKWHNIWKKHPKYLVYADSAESAYMAYIEMNNESTEALSQAYFNFGELLFNRNKFKEASVQYSKVRLGKPSKEILHKGNYGAIVSLDKSIGENDWSDLDEKRYSDLAAIYLQDHPKGKYELDIRFKKALLAYNKKRYQEAKPDFKTLGWNFPKEAKGKKAQDLYLDILNIEKDYSSLKESAKFLLDKEQDPKRIISLKTIYEQAYFSEVQEFETNKQLDKAVSSYFDFANNNSTSKLAPEALWNASQLLSQLKQYSKAANTCDSLYQKYPKFNKANDCLVLSVQIYENSGDLSKAANVVDKLVVNDLKNKTKWLVLAADFNLLLNRPEKASNYFAALPETTSVQDKAKNYSKLLSIVDKARHPNVYAKTRSQLLSLGIEPYYSEYIVESVEDEFNKKNYSQAFSQAKKIVGSQKASNVEKARARLVQAQVLEQEYKKQSVKAKVSRIAMVISLKTEKLEKAQKAFQAVVDYGDPKLSITALYRLGLLYQDYSDSIKSMSDRLPSSISAEEKETFSQELESLSLPMEERSVETLTQALELSKESKLVDKVVVDLKKEIDKRNFKKSFYLNGSQKNMPVYLPVFLKGYGS